MKALLLLQLFAVSGIAEALLTPAEINAAVVGDSSGRPVGHETKPYKENLPDPYVKFYENADPHAVLGE